MDSKSPHSQPTNSHHPHSYRSGKKSRGMERFLNSRLFIVLGAIFLLVGIYSSVSSLDNSGGFYQLIMTFLAPSADGPVVEIVGGGLLNIIYYFLPAISVFTGSLIFRKKFQKVIYPLSLVAAFYLIVIQFKISLYNLIFGGCFYPDFMIALLFLLFPTILLLIISKIHNKSALPLLTCFYFYASVVLMVYNFPTHFEYAFTLIILFSLNISWIAQRINKPVIHLINLIFANGFLGLFWLRKFVVNAKPEFLPIFFIFGILFFLLFYTIVLFTASKKENPLPRWMQFAIFVSNLLVYLGTTSFVLIHYYTPGYIAVLVIGLLLFHILGLWLIKRYKTTVWTLPHYYAIILLAALVLPSIIQQGRTVLFTAVLSVLMVGYAIQQKRQTALWVSVVALAVMVVWFLFTWAHVFVPHQLLALSIPEPSLMGYGLLMGLAVTGALWFTAWQLQKGALPIASKRFNKLKYERMVRVGMLVSLFLTIGWSMFCLSSLLTGTKDYTSVAWFIAGALFFTGAIYSYRGRVSSFKKPILYAALAFALTYPLLVHYNMTIFRTGLIMRHDLHGSVLFLHYLSLALVLVLGRMVLRRIHRQNPKNKKIQQGVELLTYLSLLFLSCTEYDNLSVIMSALQNSSGMDEIVGPDQLAMNKLLPYSLLLGVAAVVMFVRSVMRKTRFLRNFAIVLFCIMLVKLFAIDFQGIGAGERTAVFLILGLFLIGFAFVYPKLVKGEPVVREFRRGNENERMKK